MIFFRVGILVLIFFSQLKSQDNSIILLKKSVKYADLSFFHDLVDVKNEKLSYKKEFEHLNDLSFDSLYYTSDGNRVTAYVIYPTKAKKLPCIIYNRGGNRDFSPISTSMVIYYLSNLASHGYMIIASSYRGNNQSEGNDEFGGSDLNDVLNLVDVLKEFSQADTTRIGMYGWSRGGMMTYMALTKPRQFKAAVICGGPTNFFDLAKERPQFEKNVLGDMIPNYYLNKYEELHKRSAIKWIYKIQRIPILIIHGNLDNRVNVEHAINMARELSIANHPNKLIVFENSDHSIANKKQEVFNAVLEWFDSYLK
jgi:dipeptidyl aminopeptidase/acylaminoacyl peptidase